MDAYKEERKKAIEHMAGSKSRVAITTDMWTSDNQRRGTWQSQHISLMIHGYFKT